VVARKRALHAQPRGLALRLRRARRRARRLLLGRRRARARLRDRSCRVRGRVRRAVRDVGAGSLGRRRARGRVLGRAARLGPRLLERLIVRRARLFQRRLGAPRARLRCLGPRALRVQRITLVG
jgi:hypothetical protein